MSLKKLLFKPGVNRENTRYTNEGGWYECDKIRFRQTMPEKIGGWVRSSSFYYLGVCRSLFSWVTTAGQELHGVGTNIKFYVEEGGQYNDITPLKDTTAAGDVTFSATDGSAVLTVDDVGSDGAIGSYVTFSGATSLGGLVTAEVLNTEHIITGLVSEDQYEVTLPVVANASDTGDGGAAVIGYYQIDTGEELQTSIVGWGAGPWGAGPWGTGTSGYNPIRRWNQTNFGEDLIFGVATGGIYYWDRSGGVSTRGVLLSSLAASADVPTTHLNLLVSDISRFVFAFGCNDYGVTDLDSLLIRWSDQELPQYWTPAATNQAGSIRLSRGSAIIAVKQARQEILTWTDTTLYSLQYVGAPSVWGAQVIGENISILNSRAATYASGVAYWMGNGVFYAYDGKVTPLVCDLRRHVFNDINKDQFAQIFAGTNEAFHEVWWFYCSAESTRVDRYVIYNYRDKIWYYGSMERTAWIDNGWDGQPLAATYSNNLVVHEVGIDDGEGMQLTPIAAHITSSQFDIDDGQHMSFVWRVMPDMTFEGSTTATPSATMSLLPLHGSGSGYNSPTSEGGVNNQVLTRSVSVPVEEYTEQLHIRVRGRQMAIKVESDEVGVQWQLGAPRIDLRPDGRR